MAYNAKILLGKILKSHGFEGVLSVGLEKAFEGNVPDMKSVFLEIEGKAVPFIISSFEIIDNTLIRIIFDGYDSYEKIREFTGCRVFLTSSRDIISPDKDLHVLKGFTINTSGNLPVGTVVEIIENPGQILLKIQDKEGREILVPFHEDLITGINNKKKIITMDLPEGLLEINN